MKNIFIVICLIFPSIFYAQEKFTLSGFVSDENNGENIIGVNIFCKEHKSLKFLHLIELLEEVVLL